jgi:hypothetical protein
LRLGETCGAGLRGEVDDGGVVGVTQEDERGCGLFRAEIGDGTKKPEFWTAGRALDGRESSSVVDYEK